MCLKYGTICLRRRERNTHRLIQLTFEHKFELCGSTCMCNSYDMFSLPYDFLNNIFFSLAYFIVRIECKTHTIYKMYVNQVFMLSARLLVTSRLCEFSTAQGFGASNPFIVQGSTVFQKWEINKRLK